MNRSIIATSAVSVLLLSGCSGLIDLAVDDGAPTTINAAQLAAAAEGVVLDQGFTVQIDCGSADVPLTVGTSVECSALDPATGDTGGYTVTITSVQGSDYEIEVVGSEVRDPSAEAVFEPASAFADLTAQAITDSLGETPVVDCGTEDIELFAGNQVLCSYSTSTTSGYVVSTITSFDGEFYEISVVEE
ncbi:MAG: hypothetical protein KIT89_05590 [Microcella sp.]|uniref:hypothetical protein n=1 Tax=Microcella sp. TaxID=1913979 RepID=UPI0024CDB9DE|nr:hypothetical protein [Microcella sp.]UYN84643.1 MAG: hypothetical protein KIT89_05590 [Microcella sp.]